MNMLSLPVEVVCGGILPHLSVCDFQALDTAFTNKCSQPQLRKVWESYQYDAFDTVLRRHEFVWLCRSGVQIVSVAIDGVVSHNPTLKKLNITSSVRDEVILKVATACLDLRELHVYNVCGPDTDDAISVLAQNCRQLHTLHISSESLTDIGLSSLACHENQLHTFHIGDAHITDASIQALCANCPHLKHIGLSNCYNLTDASLTAIANSYPHLQSISFYSDNFTNDGLIYVANKCHELRSVSVWCDNITSRGLTALWAANPNLMDVHIRGGNLISDDDIIQLAQCCHLLQKLNISDCSKITDAAVIAVAEHCPQLRSLNIRFCFKVSDASLIALGRHCYDLKSLHISYNTQCSDVGIAALAAGCPLLQEFYAFDTKITDNGVVALTRGCRDLRKIDIWRARLFSAAAMSAIAENCPLISELSISNVDDDCMHIIAKHCRNLTVVSLIHTNLLNVDAVISVIKSSRMLREVHCSGCFKQEKDKAAILEWSYRVEVYI